MRKPTATKMVFYQQIADRDDVKVADLVLAIQFLRSVDLYVNAYVINVLMGGFWDINAIQKHLDTLNLAE
jgi:hypothetical protein